MPPSGGQSTPLGRTVRDNTLTLNVCRTSSIISAADPTVPPLRGQVIGAMGVMHSAYGHDPFVLFDSMAAWVMANCAPAQEGSTDTALNAASITGEVLLERGFTT